MTDFYDVLGVARDAKEEEIKKAYWELSKKYHPDVNPGDKEAESQFKKISEAYTVLHNPKKRQIYNKVADKTSGSSVIRNADGKRPGRVETKPFQDIDFSDMEQRLARAFGFHTGSKKVCRHKLKSNKKTEANPIGVCLAVIGVTLIYQELGIGGKMIALAAGILTHVFLSIWHKKGQGGTEKQYRIGIPMESEAVSEAVLPSEEDTALIIWDMYGKTSMLIECDVKENQVDIDLGKSFSGVGCFS